MTDETFGLLERDYATVRQPHVVAGLRGVNVNDDGNEVKKSKPKVVVDENTGVALENGGEELVVVE